MSMLKLQWIPQDTSEPVCRTLPAGKPVRLGRAPAEGWAVTGDMSISREHFDVWDQEGQLAVRCLDTARNSIVLGSETVRQAVLACGASFRIGATTFLVLAAEPVPAASVGGAGAEVPADLLLEYGYRPGELKQYGFGSAEQQIEILANLPRLIAQARSDDELALMIARLLLEGIPQADAVAVVQYSQENMEWDPDRGTDPPEPSLMKVETRDGLNIRFRPSRRLLLKSLSMHQSMLHVWENDTSSTQFTMTEGLGWAFCSPVRGEGCAGWCLYVSGQGTRSGGMLISEEDLRGDLRFTELLAQFIGSIRHIRLLQDQKTQLSAFFSPKIVENLTAGHSGADLAPAEREVTVLFCDLRGFSKRSESLQHDLLTLLQSVSDALGLMADGVLDTDGAIADFQGDAVLGFWGWPLPHPEGALPACRAALRIDAAFRRVNAQNHPLLKGLSCGIGIAHGRALAGKIGTDKQSKIGVFGPVVDLVSRLESLTKGWGVTICLDSATADSIRAQLNPEVGRLRLLGHVQLKGSDFGLTLYGLLPPESQHAEFPTSLLQTAEGAAEAVRSGNWDQARKYLQALPPADGPANLLRAFLEQAGPQPPAQWNGLIPV